MPARPQSRFDNPHGTRNPPGLLSAAEAAAFLRVKRATLYSYASRGWVRSLPNPTGSGNLYAREDLTRLRQRRDARSGHGPTAAAALSYGEPILETAICRIGPQGPLYRGRAAVALAEGGASFESVCEWLWTGTDVPHPHWPEMDPRPSAAVGEVTSFGAMLAVAAGAASRLEPDDPRHAMQLLAAAQITTRGAGTKAGAPSRSPLGIASTFTAAIGVPAHRRQRAARSFEAALILCADHELTASTFAARIAASTGASLWACLTAGMATLSGPRHGGAPALVSAFVARAPSPGDAARLVADTLRHREPVPGFGHPLYPRGDPRGAAIFALARRDAERSSGLRHFEAIAKAVAQAGGELPSLDFGLAALVAAHDLPPETASAVFALGRCAGIIAHVFEQRRDGRLLRPRARYTGVDQGI